MGNSQLERKLCARMTPSPYSLIMSPKVVSFGSFLRLREHQGHWKATALTDFLPGQKDAIEFFTLPKVKEA